MILIFSAIALAIAGIGGGLYISKCRFDDRASRLLPGTSNIPVKADDLNAEIDKLSRLQLSIKKAKANASMLDIPTPEALSYSDDVNSSLNKISRFFEKHNCATVGTEQIILSLLPTSQIGQSLYALSHSLPPHLGEQLFGPALGATRNGLHTLPEEGVHRFVDGITHLSHASMASLLNHVHHHDVVGSLLVPVKSGVFHAVGGNDAVHSFANSLSEVSEHVTSSLESTASLGELTDASDIDISGHIPVITIAISSFREFQLLSDGATTTLDSIKNIALDAAGAGLGAAGGAKAGAVAGGFLGGPFGAAIGGLVGAVGGAIAGRMLTNHVKQAPLRNAIETYKSEYDNMKSSTASKSRSTLADIKEYTDVKRSEFHDAKILEEIPVVEYDTALPAIGLAIYQFIINEVSQMRNGIAKLKTSLWYSNSQYVDMAREYEKQLRQIERQLPTPELIENNPDLVLKTLLSIKMPNRATTLDFQTKVNECRNKLKEINDKNDSSLLMWSYMVNNLYQKTLNDVAEYSNGKMEELNNVFEEWKTRLSSAEQNVITEKRKLGM